MVVSPFGRVALRADRGHETFQARLKQCAESVKGLFTAQHAGCRQQARARRCERAVIGISPMGYRTFLGRGGKARRRATAGAVCRALVAVIDVGHHRVPRVNGTQVNYRGVRVLTAVPWMREKGQSAGYGSDGRPAIAGRRPAS